LSIIRNHILRSNGIVLSWLTPIGADRPTSSTTDTISGYCAIQQRKYNRLVRTLFSDSLLFTRKKERLSPVSSSDVYLSFLSNQGVTTRTNEYWCYEGPSKDLFKLQICALTSTFQRNQHTESLFRELFNTITNRQNP